MISALPFYPDRIIHWALILTTEHIFLRTFTTHTYAAIPNRGTHCALKAVKRALRDPNAKYCLKIDAHHFFPSIRHDAMMEKIERRIKDKVILALFREVIYGYKDVGMPIGNLTSQYLANLYLSDVDHYMMEKYHCKWYFRYMDDIIILGWSKAWLHRVKRKLDRLFADLGLIINPNWQVYPVQSRGVDFVGYRIFPEYTLLRARTKKRMIRKMGDIKARLHSGMDATESDIGCISAYIGILQWCDGYRLRAKYITPISNIL